MRIYKEEKMVENMTTEEIKVILDNDPELKEKAALLLELYRLFKQLPPERRALVIENIKEQYPAVVQALKVAQKTCVGR